mgnify:CR=1 FL=1
MNNVHYSIRYVKNTISFHVFSVAEKRKVLLVKFYMKNTPLGIFTKKCNLSFIVPLDISLLVSHSGARRDRVLCYFYRLYRPYDLDLVRILCIM